MEEIWKDVVGYEGLYQVSNTGKIRSLSHSHYLKEKKAQTNNYGYLTVLLSKQGKQQRKSVHRIVARAFLRNPNGLPQINHIDENKKNNNALNLEWCDASHNSKCYYRNHPNKRRNGKKSGKRVLQLSLDGSVVKEWENSRQVYLETGMSDWSVSQCCRGEWKTAYGYKWQYSN